MNTLGIILSLIIFAGIVYLAYWAIQKTLSENTGKNRRERRSRRR